MEISAEVRNEILESSVLKIANMAIGNRKVHDRFSALEAAGLHVEQDRRCGPGGVGSLHVIRGIVYVQISAGYGRWNYAPCARIGQVRSAGIISKSYFLSDL